MPVGAQVFWGRGIPHGPEPERKAGVAVGEPPLKPCLWSLPTCGHGVGTRRKGQEGEPLIIFFLVVWGEEETIWRLQGHEDRTRDGGNGNMDLTVVLPIGGMPMPKEPL